MAELWEEQPWDTPASFARFRAYYLPQPPPRSALEAYRRYKEARKRRERGTTKTLPGSWQNWFQGRDRQGNPIPGAIGWQERADAYDAHQQRLVEAQRQQELLDRMRQYDEAAMKVVERGIRTVERMLDFPLQETTVSQGGQQITFKPARWSLNTVPPLMMAVDRLYRLLYSLPTETIDQTTRVQPGYDHLSDEQLNDELAALLERYAQAGARAVPDFAQGADAAGAGSGDSAGADSAGAGNGPDAAGGG